MKRFLGLAAALLFAACMAQTAGAAIIDYTAYNIGDNRWQYDYTIYNDSPSGIGAFDIYFNGFSFSNELEVLAQPNDWDALILNPSFDDPFTLTAWTLGDPLLQDDSLGLFSVVFNWFEEGAPGSQMFTMYDNILNWNVVASGNTYGEPGQVPEPQTFMLLGTGLVGLMAYYRRNRKR